MPSLATNSACASGIFVSSLEDEKVKASFTKIY